MVLSKGGRNKKVKYDYSSWRHLCSCFTHKKNPQAFSSVYTGNNAGKQPSGFFRQMIELVLLCNNTTALLTIPELTAVYICMIQNSRNYCDTVISNCELELQMLYQSCYLGHVEWSLFQKSWARNRLSTLQDLRLQKFFYESKGQVHKNMKNQLQFGRSKYLPSEIDSHVYFECNHKAVLCISAVLLSRHSSLEMTEENFVKKI